MTFEYAAQEYRISFKHGTLALPTAPNVTCRGTSCRIEQVHGIYRRVGNSYCHPNDNFCRETGRKLALKNVLDWRCGERWRIFRTAAWKAYLERPR